MFKKIIINILKCFIKILNFFEYIISYYYYDNILLKKKNFEGLIIERNNNNCIIVCNGGAYLIGSCYLYKSYIEYVFSNIKIDIFLLNYEKIDSINAIKNLYNSYIYLSKKYNNLSLYGESAGAHLILLFLSIYKNNIITPPNKVILYSPWFGNVDNNYSYVFKILVDNVINISNVSNIMSYNWDNLNKIDILCIYSNDEFLKKDIEIFLSKCKKVKILKFDTIIHCPTIITYKLHLNYNKQYLHDLKYTIYNFMQNKNHNLEIL